MRNKISIDYIRNKTIQKKTPENSLVNETFGHETRDETETFGFQSETRPRPRPSHIPRDRDETETLEKWVSRSSRDRDVETETTTLLHSHLCANVPLKPHSLTK